MTVSTLNEDVVTPAADVPAPIIIDLGKQRRKRVKDLRRGTGRLADEVNGCLAELRAVGTLSPSSQTVIVVVRERRRRSNSLKGLLPGL